MYKPMTIADFKLRVAGVVNRPAGLFVVNGVDNLLAAMNDARRSAQRDHSFQLLKKDVFIEVGPTGADWTSCKATPSAGGTTVKVKRPDTLWNYAEGAGTYLRTSFIDSGVLGDYRRSLPVYDTSQLIITNQPATFVRRTFWYLQGTKLFVTNNTAAVWYLLDGVTWLDDLSGGDAPDIFLTYFTDWLVYATVAALNVYLKDSERFPIDAAILGRLWESVKQYDGEVANSGQWTNLD